ncbi:hypothetical protein HYX16_06680 [Candidatus Woesearchaeota archaeon]|nr:hypothetical protein [Candidatus Woesearchaeota archaeon]
MIEDYVKELQGQSSKLYKHMWVSETRCNLNLKYCTACGEVDNIKEDEFFRMFPFATISYEDGCCRRRSERATVKKKTPISNYEEEN